MTRTSPSDGIERVEITCADGVRLHGHLVRSRSDAPAGLPVLLSPATGVKQHYYLRFVHWLAQQGHDVLVFDYRGIGLSLHGPLKHCRASLAEWGQQDQVAALDWLLQRTGSAQGPWRRRKLAGGNGAALANSPSPALRATSCSWE